ncbi:hypothetical protein Z517_01338 [Fonsecaea pedrosoi CBS 271.37]|uniref:Ig-like domain-containing protein n=1 Tax=Fonsecaea pedrosoi CBS 271.37 TaxID=1442368 RepID=A0A0D2H504_9EURO|nr:uncharacterized protein Z517_01338 [Fonsecaea pedrosoi CBS 271.37]KIW85945.1 hypothetical protein Z517_01338 [Fonsecaea pedrosoi CBS 271.37]
MATTTTWDAIVFIASYAFAVFLTLVDAQSCGNMTTTVSVIETVTETISLMSGPVTVTMTESIDAFNFTHVSGTTYPGITATTDTVTDTVTVGNESSSLSPSAINSVHSGSAITLTSTTKITSYVNTTVSATGPATSSGASSNLTRASVPGSLTLTFPIVTASPPCASGLPNATCGNGSFISVTGTSVHNLTSLTTVISTAYLDTITSVALVTTVTVVNTSKPFFVNGTFETSFPFATPDLSSALSVASSAFDSITGNHPVSSIGTSTSTTTTTVTLSKSSATVGAANSTLGTATLMMFSTMTTTSTVEPVDSALSKASSLLSNASSEIGTKTVITTTTATPIGTILSAVSSLLSEATSEIASVSETVGASTTTTTVYTTVAATKSSSYAAGTTYTVTVPVYVNTTTTSVYEDTVTTIDRFNTSDTVPSKESAITFLPSTVSVGVPLLSVIMTSESFNITASPIASSNVSVSLPMVSASVSESQASSSVSVSIYTPTMTGAASSVRVPGVFGLITRFLMVIDLVKPKTTLVRALSALPPDPVTAPSPPSMTTTPGVSVSVSVSVSTMPCNCTTKLNMTTTSSLDSANSTVWLTSTVLRTSTITATTTTQIPGAHPAPANSSLASAVTTIPSPAVLASTIPGATESPSLTASGSATGVGVGVTITPASIVGDTTLTVSLINGHGNSSSTAIPVNASASASASVSATTMHSTTMTPFPNTTTMTMAMASVTGNDSMILPNPTTMTVNSSTTVHPTVTSFLSTHHSSHSSGFVFATASSSGNITTSSSMASCSLTRLTVHTVTALLLVAVTAWFVL